MIGYTEYALKNNRHRGLPELEHEFLAINDVTIRLIERRLGNDIVLNEFQRHYLKTGVWLGDWTGPVRRRGKTTAVILRHVLSKGEPLPLDLLTDEPDIKGWYAHSHFRPEFRRIHARLKGVMPVRDYYDTPKKGR